MKAMLRRFPAGLWPLLLLVVLLTGCGGSQQGGTTGEPGATEAAGRQTAPAPEPESGRETTRETTVAERREDPAYGYTYGEVSGNRVVEGAGGLPDSDPVDVPLDGTPEWVVGVPLESDTAWVVVLEDGRVQAFRLTSPGEAEPIGVSPEQLAPGQPPLVKARDGSLELVVADDPRASGLTHPVPAAPDGEGLVGVEDSGRLFLEPAGSLPVTAPPDARLVRSAGGNLATLSDPTTRYQHDVLGDDIEADSIMVLRPGAGNRFEPAGHVRPRSGGVFEMISPLWFDAPGEDRQLLAVTESAPGVGARVAVYGAGGALRAAGPFIGEPMRWRHLLAAGPFGPDGEVELAAVRTPHLGGRRVLRPGPGLRRAGDNGHPVRLHFPPHRLPQPGHRPRRGLRRRRALGAARPERGLHGAGRHPPRGGRGQRGLDPARRRDHRHQPGLRHGRRRPGQHRGRPVGRRAAPLALGRPRPAVQRVYSPRAGC